MAKCPCCGTGGIKIGDEQVASYVRDYSAANTGLVLAKLRIWANNAIRKYGPLDALGYLLQYINELDERNTRDRQIP